LEMVQTYLVCFLKYPGIEKDNGLQLIAHRVEALIALIEVMYAANLGFKSISVLTNGVRRKSKEPPKMATRPAKATNPGKRSRGLPFGVNVQVKTKLIVLEQNQIPVKK